MPLNEGLKKLISEYSNIYSDFDGIEISHLDQQGLGEDRLIHMAASHGTLEELTLLIKGGADVNAQGDIGLTPLHLAASKGRIDHVKMLLRNGARKNIGNDFDELPIDWAKTNNQFDIIEILN